MAELLCCGQAELDLKAQMVKELEAQIELLQSGVLTAIQSELTKSN